MVEIITEKETKKLIVKAVKRYDCGKVFGESFLRELLRSKDLRKALRAEWLYFKSLLQFPR